MRLLFHWFYCLPVEDAVLLILLATEIFLLLRRMFRNTTYWKAWISLLLFCWIAAILFGTLGQRSEQENPSVPVLTPFYSYYIALNGGQKELFRTNFMNIVLFYPTGLLFRDLLPRRWRTGLKVIVIGCAFMLLSISIEYTQYRFGLGLAEVDDVIHNTLGTILGALACSIPTIPLPSQPR